MCPSFQEKTKTFHFINLHPLSLWRWGYFLCRFWYYDNFSKWFGKICLPTESRRTSDFWTMQRSQIRDFHSPPATVNCFSISKTSEYISRYVKLATEFVWATYICVGTQSWLNTWTKTPHHWIQRCWWPIGEYTDMLVLIVTLVHQRGSCCNHPKIFFEKKQRKHKKTPAFFAQ